MTELSTQTDKFSTVIAPDNFCVGALMVEFFLSSRIDMLTISKEQAQRNTFTFSELFLRVEKETNKQTNKYIFSIYIN